MYKVVSLFAGCGGLDLGFTKAGFNIVWANEFDKDIHETYQANHPSTLLDKRDIRHIESHEIPDCIGIIGGPPCQSWSEAGKQRGINDSRGKLFFEYIRVLRDKKPLFFLAENVSGILAQKHSDAYNNIIKRFEEIGYKLSYQLLNAKNYGVPQDRKRVIIVGFRTDLNIKFNFPEPDSKLLTLNDAIHDLKDNVSLPINKSHHNPNCEIANHEYMLGTFSTIYMSRNRVRAWDEPSFTIQAGGRHAPIHPQANKMIKKEKDEFIFDNTSEYEYRRLSVRECARVQTFPDEFIFKYKNLAAGYKMIGNAVPVELARRLADKIREDLNYSHDKSLLKQAIAL